MKKDFYSAFFKGKKITVMGLGILGRGIQVTKFLAEAGAILTVTDLKDAEYLKASIALLKKYDIRYVLEKHDLSDFKNVDMVVKAAGVPLDSIYIKEAHKHNVPVVMDASLFARVVSSVSPKINIVGITGTRGKSMTTALIHHVLSSNAKKLKCKVHLGGNMRMKATLPLLKEVNPGDVVVLELDSWQCQGFGDDKISPDIAVFTSFMPDHLNYYKGDEKQYLNDKLHICMHQDKSGILVTSKAVSALIPKTYAGKKKVVGTKEVSDIKMNIIGSHNLQNAAYAFEVAYICGLSEKDIKKSIKSFKGLEGRLHYLGKKRGVHVYNDNNATTPEAVLAGVKAVSEKYPTSNIILIAGGADKELKLDAFDDATGYCKHIILLPGTGTNRLSEEYTFVRTTEVTNVNSALLVAFAESEPKDVIIFSPGFASFGLFKHEYDRNDIFLKTLKAIKE